MIISIFALFTLFIACLGLFGLTLYVTKTQTKAIGIKKVFGSSEKALIYSVLKGNAFMVAISSLISIPITLEIMNKWLNNYSYKVKIGGGIFAFTFLIAMIVVLSTVFYHAFRASRINPAEVLKNE